MTRRAPALLPGFDAPDPVRAPAPVRPTRWERSAERENARRAARAPLLAAGGLVPVATADEREASWECMSAAAELRVRLACERAELVGAELRAEVAARVSSEELAALDRRRDVLPRAPEYSADFWRRMRDALARGESVTLPTTTWRS